VLALLAGAAILAGAIAAIAGFGIGSILTPLLTLWVPAKIAVAAVSIPHFVATTYRLWLIRKDVDLRLLRTFGLMSAAGGLTGALANQWLASRVLELVLAALLMFVGFGGLFGWTRKLKFTGFWAWLAGLVSGFLGGLVGNQGGLRAGAMLGFGVSRDAFIATATATGVIVDAARLPVYVAGQWRDLTHLAPEIGLMTVGVIVGTIAGLAVLRSIPEKAFLTVVSFLLIALGIWLAVKTS
jgi:uncharacterized membrane protein YfcA